ncbi:MAG: 7,8-didemethyl-8-hydroxy-5-deazariboflavin synthase CofG [Deltaproteobacteria bacterium]|nr:7,8-didemethyl-8-hydroxy-5-deazariboflavin synthase CofG [Deltaproteobacteria bacterium]MBI3075615.1 7,8-didemethyl-8-hydroxy-5-deazariboflavin synthase CofG [Deltaproteobacteria bacterium]
MAEAVAVKRARTGQVVTYSPKVFIPLTTLCRDRCGYCTFRKDPGEAGAHTMLPEQVLAVARAGAAAGCKEALFSLGDRPEAAFPEMRDTLRALGHRTTLGYLREACALVLRESPLLPHANPGVMGRRDLGALRPVNVSMGLMLENVSERLCAPGGPHGDAPDKRPSVRLRTLEEAGRLRIPFTTGILIGIGETWEERVDSLLAIRALHERYGHVQEVIIQNFRHKATIPMRDHPEPSLLEMLRTVAVARLILPDEVNLQAPPNLTPGEYRWLLRAGINDWGGISPVTRDFINPEAPWPELRELREVTAAEGFVLRARLAIYPEFITRREEFLDEGLRARVAALADDQGLVPEGRLD